MQEGQCACVESSTGCRPQLCLFNLTTLYIVFVSFFRTGWEYYLHHRQMRVLSSLTSVPEPFNKFMTVEQLNQIKYEGLVNTYFHLYKATQATLFTMARYFLMLDCRVWQAAGLVSTGPYLQVLVFNSLLALVQNLAVKVMSNFLSALGLYFDPRKHRPRRRKRSILRMWTTWAKAVVSSQLTMAWLRGNVYSLCLTRLSLMGPHCVLGAYCLLRVYKDVVLRHLVDECRPCYTPLKDGPLLQHIRALTVILHFRLDNIYVKRGTFDKKLVGAKVRGLRDSRYLVLGWSLAEGLEVEQKGWWKKKIQYFTTNHVSAVTTRAVLSWAIVDKADTFLIQITRLPRLVVYLLMLTFLGSLYRNVGFLSDQPPIIGFHLAYHLCLPVIVLGQYIHNRVRWRRCLLLDNIVTRVGMGHELAEYLARAVALKSQIPVSDHLYAAYYYKRPPPMTRIAMLT